MNVLSSPSAPMAPRRPRLPGWMRQPLPTSQTFAHTRELVQGLRLHTVCESAKCPNHWECWSKGTATFMIDQHGKAEAADKGVNLARHLCRSAAIAQRNQFGRGHNLHAPPQARPDDGHQGHPDHPARPPQPVPRQAEHQHQHNEPARARTVSRGVGEPERPPGHVPPAGEIALRALLRGPPREQQADDEHQRARGHDHQPIKRGHSLSNELLSCCPQG